jgi:hypothetical protein
MSPPLLPREFDTRRAKGLVASSGLVLGEDRFRSEVAGGRFEIRQLSSSSTAATRPSAVTRMHCIPGLDTEHNNQVPVELDIIESRGGE